MTTQQVAKQETSLSNEEWYLNLVENCMSAKVELETSARDLIIQLHWEWGKEIYKENYEMEREKVYGERIIQNLANDLGKSPATLWKSIQFYKMYPGDEFQKAIESAPWGKDMSWYRITKEVLPTKKEDKEGDNSEGKIENIKEGKQRYKLQDVIVAFKEWAIEQGYGKDEKMLEKATNRFRDLLIDNS